MPAFVRIESVAPNVREPRVRPGGSTGVFRVDCGTNGNRKPCIAAGISAALSAAAVAFVGGRADTSELQVWFPWLGTMLLTWAVGWPVWETARAAATNDAR
jgi:hypothetical protein